MIHEGSCHCGNIKFEVEGDIGEVYECNCSHCSRKGYLMWFAPRAQFKLLTPENDLGTYTFNKHAIRHHFCGTCGCAPFGFGKDRDGADIAAINVRCLPDLDKSALAVKHVDGRSL
ncbi:MAG TPA: GFA family protein [Gammaproteobacteria bacterium]|nr:GFA family protein [Gammaproteobacteria bacterium]